MTSSGSECPLCGHEIPADCPARIDLDAKAVVYKGRFTVLTTRQMDILSVLIDAHPRVVTKEHIMDRIYFLSQDAAEEKIVDVFVCKMRAALKGLGIEIVTHWGKGYSIQYTEES
ncbi:hypothetical protein LCGC14_1530780 [marine sediment metagenome]|uniref:OmpR/PhoB-type domain-containing protein n=1 Tax=marine sediment metagenome TaxID=412755 RepID=A0A0F9LBP7_9ZZZZ